MNSETTFYHDEKAGVRVTSQRLVFPSGSYNPQEVSDAAMVMMRANQGMVLALIALGALFLLFGSAQGAVMAVLGFGLIAAGMAVRLTARQQYVVRLMLNGRPVNAFWARDVQYVSAVNAAVNQAIRAAGGWRPSPRDEE